MDIFWISEDVPHIPCSSEWSSLVQPGICQQIIHTHENVILKENRHTLSQLLNNKEQSPSEGHSSGRSLLQQFSGKNHQGESQRHWVWATPQMFIWIHIQASFSYFFHPFCFMFTQLRLFGCSSGLVLHMRFIFRILQGLERNLTPHSHRTVTWPSQINRQAWDG